MSGALAQYRPWSRPLIIGGEPVWKTDEHGNIVTRQVSVPGGVYKNGRCVEWRVVEVPQVAHVLDHVKPADRPSKHAKGRMRPRTRAEQRRAERLRARFVQVSKSVTVDQQFLSGLFMP